MTNPNDSVSLAPKGGKFGVYCPAEFSKELENCEKNIDYAGESGGDSFYIRKTYENCGDFIPDTCMQVNIVELPYANMFYCLMY